MDELRIFHPSDLTKTSEDAFAHGLRLALGGSSALTVLHVAPWGAEPRWDDFPASADLAARWGMDAPGPGQVHWVDVPGANPVRAILSYLDEHSFDLVVVASQGRRGFDAWFSGSVAEPISRLSKAMTLFVRQGCRGIVDRDTGEVSLDRILVPVVADPSCGLALEVAPCVPEWFGLPGATSITTCFVGDPGDAPDVGHHELIVADGPAADAIVKLAEAQATDLIVMVTAGREGVLDAFRGSTTDRVVRRAPCPVLVINAAA